MATLEQNLPHPIRVDPGLAFAYIGRTAAYMGKAEPDWAIHDCDRARRLNVSNPGRVYRLRSIAFSLKDDDAGAQAEAEMATQLDLSLPAFIAPSGTLEPKRR